VARNSPGLLNVLDLVPLYVVRGKSTERPKFRSPFPLVVICTDGGGARKLRVSPQPPLKTVRYRTVH
jgi:hypothetical protein